MNVKGLELRAQAGTPLLAHVGFHLLIDQLGKGLDDLIGGHVPTERMGLPVLQMDLVAHFQKKIHSLAAHESECPIQNVQDLSSDSWSGGEAACGVDLPVAARKLLRSLCVEWP